MMKKTLYLIIQTLSKLQVSKNYKDDFLESPKDFLHLHDIRFLMGHYVDFVNDDRNR